jgi:hypothetical protein
MDPMVTPVLQSGLSGLKVASDSFDRAAGQVTRLAGAVSAAQSAATVEISPEARSAIAAPERETGTLEGAMADTRVAKYAFMANVKVLQTGDEMSNELTKLGQRR